MMNVKLMKWVAAGVLAGAPAMVLARTHHVTTAAAPLAAITTTPIAATPVAKLAAHKKISRTRKATKAHVRKAATKHRALKARHRATKAKKH
jgi:hypothetical protein